MLYVTRFKSTGCFLEIGAGDGSTINNTLLLESTLGWRGIGIELDPDLVALYNAKRSNLCLLADATSLDYQKNLDKYSFPAQIDYLQIDIDPAHQSLAALREVLKTNRRFTVITFEHDLYVSKENVLVKNLAYKLLGESGYVRIMNNVEYDGSAFEDWYIDPLIVNGWRVKLFRFFHASGLLELKIRLLKRSV